MSRQFIDAPAWSRCSWVIRLKDGSKVNCGRWQNPDVRRGSGRLLCAQHNSMWCVGKRDANQLIICDGCRVRLPHEHRCHGKLARLNDVPVGRECECPECGNLQRGEA